MEKNNVDKIREKMLGNFTRLGWSLYETGQAAFGDRELHPDYILLKGDDVYGFVYIRGSMSDAEMKDEIAFVNTQKPHCLIVTDGTACDVYRDGSYLEMMTTVPTAAEYDLLPEEIDAADHPDLFETDTGPLQEKANMLDTVLIQYGLLMALNKDGSRTQAMRETIEQITQIIPEGDERIYRQLGYALFATSREDLSDSCRRALAAALAVNTRLRMVNADDYSTVPQLLVTAFEEELRSEIFTKYLDGLKEDPIDEDRSDPLGVGKAVREGRLLTAEEMTASLERLAKKPPVTYSLRLIEQVQQDGWDPAELSDENFIMQIKAYLSGARNRPRKKLSDDFAEQKISETALLLGQFLNCRKLSAAE